MRQNVGMVFQNPDDQLFMSTVEEDVAFGPANMGLPDEEIRRRVSSALRAVGAEDLANRSPWQLSGGQKRRVAIATVLSMEPNILVLDEPTSNLDWSARRQLIGLLKGFDHTILVATHDLAMVNELCGRILVIDHGRIIADSDPGILERDERLRVMLGIE